MSDGATLDGLGVLVTRPAEQASRLCTLLETAGALAIRLPAIAIEPANDLQDVTSRACAQAADFMIFTSANAVRFAGGLLERQPRAELIAIGPATLQALAAAGRHAELKSEGSVDSDGLLEDPRLARLAGRRILVVKGRKGRELIAEELTRRGARVDVAEVYVRQRAVPDDQQLARVLALLAEGRIQVITATSAEVAESLLTILPGLRGTREPRWLAPGPRVAAKLREYGVTAPIIEAASAVDHELVSAIVRWRAGESGA